MTISMRHVGLLALGAVSLGCGWHRASVASPAGAGPTAEGGATPAATRESGIKAGSAVGTINGRFHLVMERDTFVAERYTRSPRRIEGEYVNRVLASRVTYAAAVAPDGSVTRLETHTWLRGSSSAIGDSTRVVTLAGDSIHVEENGRARWVAGAGGAQLVMGPSGALLEQLVARARRIGAAHRVNPPDSVALRVFEASGRSVQRITLRWTDDEHVIATSEGGRGVPLVLRDGLVMTVMYQEPAGMQIVRADAAR
jgi:hypothetical protein